MYAGNFAIPYDALDIGLRLVAATLIGMALGLERMLRGKPTGMRTLGLVSFAAALVTLSLMHVPTTSRAIGDALARVLQGAVQGVLVGHRLSGQRHSAARCRSAHSVYNLTISGGSLGGGGDGIGDGRARPGRLSAWVW